MSTHVPEVELAKGNQRRNRWSNMGMLVEVGVACLVITIAALILFAKIDAKVSHTDHNVAAVLSLQQANVVATNTRSDCQDRAFLAIVQDARLALQGDRNIADYAKIPTKC